MWNSGDADLIAYSGNYRFDERAAPERQRHYEESLPITGAGFDEWDQWHRDIYLWRALHKEVPDTFTALNGAAAHSRELEPEQNLVRVENLEYALGAMGLAVDELHEALEVARTGKGSANYSQADAEAKLMELCEQLNDNPYSVRPRFAGFLGDVEDSVDLPDWPNQVRDRFGLGHYAAPPGTSIPVALMRYKVRAVLEEAKGKPEAVHPVCMPTVLDAQFSQFFVPAPRELTYGRTLDLADDADCTRKIAEILHLRIEYRPEHVFKIGSITTGLTKLDALGLDALRANHFFCLQYDSNRDDFGTPPDDWSSP
jgi:hypothetical protein